MELKEAEYMAELEIFSSFLEIAEGLTAAIKSSPACDADKANEIISYIEMSLEHLSPDIFVDDFSPRKIRDSIQIHSDDPFFLLGIFSSIIEKGGEINKSKARKLLTEQLLTSADEQVESCEKLKKERVTPSQPEEFEPLFEINSIKPFWVHALLVSLLLMALFEIDPLDLDHSFFVLLRFACFIGFGFWAYEFHKKGKIFLRNFAWIVALAYNPFLPLELDRDVWEIINVVTILIIGLFPLLSRKATEIESDSF